MATRLTGRLTLLLLVFVAVMLTFPAIAFAQAAPTIASDKADYSPGSTVNLTGANWQPGESVHINVNDTYGASWSRDVDVTANVNGEITDSFNLPNWFVSDYDVTASGAAGGTAKTTFTDAASLTLLPTSGLPGMSVSVTTGGGEFSANTNNISIYWDGTVNTTNGTLRATCSTNSGGNINTGCSFTVPAGSSVGSHRVVATQQGDLTKSVDAAFTVTAPACTAPSVTTQPTNQSITYGANASFTAAASGSPAPTVQWQVSPNGTNWTNVSGATNGTLTLTKPSVSQSGNQYRVVFTNSCGNATSNAATLQVAKENLTISGAIANNKTYDGTTNATVGSSNASLVGVVSGDSVSIDSSGYSASFDNKNVGTNKAVTVTGVALGGTDASNYTVSQPTGLKADITKKTLTVNGVTASNKVYDGTTNAQINTSGASLSGVVQGDAVTLGTTDASGSFADKNVGAGKSVQISDLSLSGADAGNYSQTQPTTTADITAKQLSASFTAADKVYDGNANATTTGSSITGGVVGSENVGISDAGASASFDNKNAGTGKTVTGTGFTLTGIYKANYSVPASLTTTANITTKTLTGNFTANDKVYDGTTAATVATKSLPGVIGTEDVTLDVNNVHFDTKNEGTAKTVSATQALSGTDKDNYSLSATTASTKADITPKDITGSLSASNKVYDGDTSATVTGRSLNGTITGDVVNLSGGTASFADKNVGTGKTVTLTGALLAGIDAGNYNLTSVDTAKADITAKTLTGSFTANNKVYDGTRSAPVASKSLSGVISPDQVTLQVSNPLFAIKDVGTNKDVTGSLSLTGDDAANYSVNASHTAKADITPKTIHGSFTASNKVYDGNTQANISSRPLAAADKVGTDDVSLSGGTATFADKNVGTAKTVTGTGFSLSGVDAGNYSLSMDNITTADITAKSVMGSFTASNKTYDGTTAATIATRSLNNNGVITGDQVNLTGGTAAFDTKTVGNGKTVTGKGFTLSGTDAGNYSLASSTLTTTANITPKSLTGNFTAKSKVYDGNTVAQIDTSKLEGVVPGDEVSLTGNEASFADKNVGTAKTVTVNRGDLSGADAGNYTLAAGPWTAKADITPKQLTGSFAAADKVYDGTTAATVATKSLPGVIGTDDVSLVVNNPHFDTKNVGTAKTVSATLALTGAGAGNYSLSATTASTKADITAKELTGSFTASNKVYDGNRNAEVASKSLPGVVTGDTVSLDLTNVLFDTKNEGTAKTVSATLALSGADGGDYTLSSTTTTTTANITPKQLTGSFAAADKVYDGDRAAQITGSSLVAGDIVSGDTVSLNDANASALFADKNVGTAKTVSAGGFSLTGTDAGNYSLSMNTTTANITARPITVTADPQSKIYGDADPALTYKVTSQLGLVQGDTFSGGLTRDAGHNVGTYAIKQGTLTAGTNYNLTFNGAHLAITARPITVTADAQAKQLGAADPALTYRVTSGNLVGTDGFTGSLTRDTGESVGTYAIKQGMLTAGTNYNLNFVGATLKIVYGSGFIGITQPINGGLTPSLTAAQTDPAFGDDNSRFKLGSTVPVKFTLKDANGALVSNAVAKLNIKKADNNPDGGLDEAISTAASTDGNLFRYDATSGQYIFNLSTKSGYTNPNGTTITAFSQGTYTLSIILEDGTSRSVNINIVR